jgi:lipopolysaccharide transport system ATP-binding protein
VSGIRKPTIPPARFTFHLSPLTFPHVRRHPSRKPQQILPLGLIGGGTLREDLNRWWAKARSRPDPLLKIGDTDHGNRVGGEPWTRRDIRCQVREGEILGIIGRNGAGKSTLLKILSRITAPTSGQVKIKGRVGSLLEVGTGCHPELTGRENLSHNGIMLSNGSEIT